jgi:hypothetical protein
VALYVGVVDARCSPFSPPFIRVVEPRFAFHTGHVTIGGSICMELLTRRSFLCDLPSLLAISVSCVAVGDRRMISTRCWCRFAPRSWPATRVSTTAIRRRTPSRRVERRLSVLQHSTDGNEYFNIFACVWIYKFHKND